ncbi:MAG: cytochrome c [Anaerolineales bacterium]|jgi:hypothetical protein
MSQTWKWVFTLVILLAAGLILVSGSLFIANWLFDPVRVPVPAARQGFRRRSSDFSSNGERIYFTGTSASGPVIRSRMIGMRDMPGGRMACVDCHGVDAAGGTVHMMMTVIEAPDIRWEHLTEEEHAAGHAQEHPAYTVETFKRAVSEGIDPSGDELHGVMPRWVMSDAQLDDLISYLQSLD